MRFKTVFTKDDLQYLYHPVLAGSFNFMVRAPNDAHIALTAGPEETTSMIEIFIGGWGNTKSVIRRYGEKPDKVEVATAGILNNDEFRAFWIRWNDGTIKVGREGETEPFMTWQNFELFAFTHVGVCTGWGATGTWKVEDKEEINTDDSLQYTFRPVSSGQLQFEFMGPHDCHVALTSDTTETDPMYEILIGCWKNSKSVIRYRREKPDKVVVESQGICNDERLTKFLIQWKSGRITVRSGTEDDPILMEWTDDNPFPITHYGVCTGWGAAGYWMVPARSAGVKSKRSCSSTGTPQADAPSVRYSEASSWVDARGGEIPPGAFVGGEDGEDLFVTRARHEGALIPGKLVPLHGRSYIAWSGGEHGKEDYQVLCNFRGIWVPTSGFHIPSGALPGGNSEDGEVLFVGRVRHEDTLTIGKVQASRGLCYISYGGVELGFDNYEVLVQRVIGYW